MTRTTSKELDQLVRIINERLGRPQYGWDRVGDKNVAHVGALTLDISYGQPRLHEVLDAGGGAREIGPRLPRGQMETQLRAILYGIDLAEANVGNYGSLPAWSQPHMTTADLAAGTEAITRGLSPEVAAMAGVAIAHMLPADEACGHVGCPARAWRNGWCMEHQSEAR